MEIPAFFVDGVMEKLILQKIGASAKIVTTGLNGKNVRIDAIAKKISSSIRILNGRYRPIIILIDREGRGITADKIVQELNSELINNNINDERIVGVADRMTENWILADWDSFKKSTNIKKDKLYSSFEGRNGVSIIKKYIPYYQKTTDGVHLFTKAKASSMKKNSASFEKFINQILPMNCKCYWTSQ